MIENPEEGEEIFEKKQRSKILENAFPLEGGGRVGGQHEEKKGHGGMGREG